MRKIIKNWIVTYGLILLNRLPEKNGLLKLRRRLELAKLYQTDKARWRVEKAREMGARVGENCRFFSLGFFSEPYLIEIGNNVIVSGRVILLTHDGSIYTLKDEIPNLRGCFGRIKIGNNCFIGMGATILQNVEIGDNCIVGAGAVVTQSVPENSVVMGNPAKVVFKTDMYKKMKKNSKYVLTHDTYPFPAIIPESEKRKMLIEHFKDLPPLKAKRKRQGNR